MTVTTAIFAAMMWAVGFQFTNQTPSDARSNQFEDPKGSTWRVFAIESHPRSALAITEVEEIRQQNPPSHWAVSVRNRSSVPIPTFALAAAVVSGDGTVKAIQDLPAIKNFKPNQVARRQIQVKVAVLTPTDRVVFFVREMTDGTGAWKAEDEDIRTQIKAAARRLPVP
jgi:hypothetical protein